MIPFVGLLRSPVLGFVTYFAVHPSPLRVFESRKQFISPLEYVRASPPHLFKYWCPSAFRIPICHADRVYGRTNRMDKAADTSPSCCKILSPREISRLSLSCEYIFCALQPLAFAYVVPNAFMVVPTTRPKSGVAVHLQVIECCPGCVARCVHVP